METVGLVAFLCLPIYFAKVGKPIFESIFLDTVGDALSPPELGKKGWGGCRSPELGKKGMGLELGHRPCHLRAGHGTVFWHEPKHGMHEIFWAMPARHEHEGHAVPKILAWRATWPSLHFGLCLDGHGTQMACRHFYNSTCNFLAFNILSLI